MRNLGYSIIHFVQLARFFGFAEGAKIAFKIWLGGNKKAFSFSTKQFKNPVHIRRGASDLPIFYQVFCELQYDVDFFLGFLPITIIDAGANVGYASLYFTAKYPNARIVSVEAEKKNFSQLQTNVAGYTNITPIYGGVWHTSGWAKIKNEQEADASFEIVEAKEGEANSFQTYTVSDLMALGNFKTVDILKIDIEGAEYFLFKENPHSWLPYVRCLIIELHDQLQPGTSKLFFEAMSRYGWRTYAKGENIICIKAE